MKLLPLGHFIGLPRYVYGNRGYGMNSLLVHDSGMRICQHDMSKLSYPLADPTKQEYVSCEITNLQ
ncbi:hypothetical protein [Vibrio phage PhiImVa-1]|nr:hypothetical protein [Vibrio phage PhiImVa-1]